MSYRIAIFIVLLTLLRIGAHSKGRDLSEQFALADSAQRERLLKDLVGGTDDYFYFHCLHYQNTRNTVALDKTLADWAQAKIGKRPQRTEIELREAILRYGDDPDTSLETLRDYFEFDPEKVLPPPGAVIDRPDLPSKLDPADISAAGFMEKIHDHDNPLRAINAKTAEWMIATKQPLPASTTLRTLLRKVGRPDVPNLLETIRKELDIESKRVEFGYLPVHKQLTLAQLDSLLESHPKLRGSRNFVEIYLGKLVPSSMAPGSEIEKRAAYLKRATGFTERLPPAMVATHSHLLRHWLQLDLQRGEVNRDRLLRYIKIPRRVDYMDRKYLRAQGRSITVGDVDLSKATGLEKLTGTDEPLVRAEFANTFQNRREHRTVRPLHHCHLAPERRCRSPNPLRQGRPRKTFLNPRGENLPGPSRTHRYRYPQRQPTPSHTGGRRRLEGRRQKRSQADGENFRDQRAQLLSENQKALDLSIDLDGLVPTSQKTHSYDSPPAQRVTREFAFPQLKGKRGAWLIEFVGNGTSSRALIRQGELHAIPRSTVAGHAFRVFDADRKLVKTATLWLGGREFRPDAETGDILVPYSTKPGRTPFIINDGELALLDHFEHEAETYELNAGIFVGRESLIAGNNAKLIARPSLTINGASAALSLLEETALTITSVDQNGTRSTERIDDIKLSSNRELVHEFIVPDRLKHLEFEISAEIEILSTQARENLSAKKNIEVNTMDGGQMIATPHLLKSGDDYRIEVLGKNGETLPGRTVRTSFRHSRFIESQEIDFISDAGGKILLGPLAGIAYVEAEVDGMTQSWQLKTDRQLGAWPEKRTFHLAAGDKLSIPPGTEPVELNWENYSLVEMRGDTSSGIWFKALSSDKDGVVIIGGLPVGEYRLTTYDGKAHTILVSAEKPAPIIGTDDLWLARSTEKAPLSLRIEAPAEGAKKLKLLVSHPDNNTRVHIAASHYAPRFHFFRTMLGASDQAPRSHWINRAENRFVSGRSIGDEYRYILERRDRQIFPGNMLPRPGVILNPWDIGASSSEMDGGGGSSMFFGEAAKSRKRSATRKTDPRSL